MPEQTRSECHNSDVDIIQTAPVSVAAVQAAWFVCVWLWQRMKKAEGGEGEILSEGGTESESDDDTKRQRTSDGEIATLHEKDKKHRKKPRFLSLLQFLHFVLLV